MGTGVALQADPGLAEPCAVWALEVRICRGTENLCVKMFKVVEPLHGGNPTLSAIDVGFQWYGKASQLENILGCKTNHVLKRCLKTSDVIWASKE